FHAFCDPPAALRLRQVLELRADGAAIVASGFLGIFAGEAPEIGELQRSEETQGIQGGFVKTPAAERGKDALALGVGVAVGGCRFPERLRGFVRDDGCTVGHGSFLQNSYFATFGSRAKNEEGGGCLIG